MKWNDEIGWARGASAALVLLASACGEDGPGHPPSPSETQDAGPRDHNDGEKFERLLIADAVEPVVRVVDVEALEVVSSFDLDGVARVYTGPSGRFGYAVQGDADMVSVLYSGLSTVDHGDHVHDEREEPSLLGYRLSGDYPVHFVAHDEFVTLFFDNSGKAHVLDETSIQAESASVRVVDTGMPHHGIALTFHDHILATRPEMLPDATRATPTGIAVYDAAGKATGQVFDGCTGVHGEATLGDHVAFGCVEGVLVISAQDDALAGQLIANPESDAAMPARVGTLRAHPKLPYVLGNFGREALTEVDLEKGEIRVHPMDGPYLQFVVDPKAMQIVLLLPSGELRVIHASTFEVQATFAVTSAATDDSNHGARYPQIAFGERMLYVSDPGRSKVHVVDVDERKVVHSIDVPGTPAKLTVMRSAHDHAH